jgi:hypothetical protein
MGLFDDFSVDNTQSGIMPNSSKGVTTDIRNSRPFMTSGGVLPAIYYDLEAQRRHALKRRPTSHGSVPDYGSQSKPPQQESQSDESSTQL